MSKKRGSAERSCVLIAGMVAVALAATPTVSLAQSGRKMEPPPHWQVSFQIRNDRQFRVAHHTGDQVHELVPWTEHADIVSLEPTGGPVENRLAVDVQDGVVSFFINDAVVAELSGAGLTTDGGIGIAAGGDLSLHVTELRIGPNHPAG